jgi:antitoxin VapB
VWPSRPATSPAPTADYPTGPARCNDDVADAGPNRAGGAADALARSLTRLTGESITEAVTTALRERLERERRRRTAQTSLAERLATLWARLRKAYDTRPVTCEECDAASERF